MALTPLNKERMFEVIAKRILKYIREENLTPGTQLPTERELSERLQVSRASIREALRVLEVLGFIELRTGEGSFVRDPLNNTVLSQFYTDYSDINWYMELVEARKILEKDIVTLAALRASKEQIEQLESIIEVMKLKLERGERPKKENLEFHQTIWEASQNRFLKEIVGTLFNFILDKESVLNYQRNVSKNFLRDHKAIYEAIKNRSPQEAAEAMDLHHQTIQETVIMQFKEREE
ncbi:FadR/GntR family transcriptional regulator [Bacillus carboniphilus]|uniref:FadR/GntR family transcriptional regulator n=1 Tax=Bacillus carboniphilus TaxID=86663 RepID=A0ABN0VUF4_9BACI